MAALYLSLRGDLGALLGHWQGVFLTTTGGPRCDSQSAEEQVGAATPPVASASENQIGHKNKGSTEEKRKNEGERGPCVMWLGSQRSDPEGHGAPSRGRTRHFVPGCGCISALQGQKPHRVELLSFGDLLPPGVRTSTSSQS
jgi:hypothetical protein